MYTKRVAGYIVVLCVLQAAACGANAKQQTLKTSLVSVNAVRDGFLAWDSIHQRTIVEDVTTRADGEARLKEYRQKRSKLEIAFSITYKLLATAALDVKQENILLALGAVFDLYKHVRALLGPEADAILPDEAKNTPKEPK